MTDNTLIEEAIRLVEEGVCVTLPVDGNSMLPFIIGGRESVILQKPIQPKVGDIVLAWADGHHYVVHRIVAVEGDAVTLMGDGNLVGKEHCAIGDIKAWVAYVVDSNEKSHDLYCPWRRVAVKVWWHLRPIRRYLLAIYRRI